MEGVVLEELMIVSEEEQAALELAKIEAEVRCFPGVGEHGTDGLGYAEGGSEEACDGVFGSVDGDGSNAGGYHLDASTGRDARDVLCEVECGSIGSRSWVIADWFAICRGVVGAEGVRCRCDSWRGFKGKGASSRW